MAVRTTDTDVKAILLTHYDTVNEPALAAFISTASGLVDYVDTCDTGNILSVTQLELIERWLAGHFYAHADQLMSQKKTGDASATFQGATAMHLDSTQYGQTAMVLDLSGCLATKNQEAKKGKVTAGVIWLGKPVSAQTEYGDRD